MQDAKCIAIPYLNRLRALRIRRDKKKSETEKIRAEIAEMEKRLEELFDRR